MTEKEIGVVFKFFEKPSVAAVKVTGSLKMGDKIHVKGATTDFEQQVSSMQIDLKPVMSVKKGDNVGIKVIDRVRPNDKIFLVKE